MQGQEEARKVNYIVPNYFAAVLSRKNHTADTSSCVLRTSRKANIAHGIGHKFDHLFLVLLILEFFISASIH